MRNAMPYPTSPAPRTPRNTSTGSNTARSSNSSTYSRPQMEGMDTNRMFELFENKAEVEILNSPADDKLAASMYGGIKKKKKVKKPKKGVSGYNFDALIKDESSSSSNSDFH